MKFKIKHIEDNNTEVLADVFCIGREVNLEYRFKKMTYGITLTLPQAIEKQIIKYVKATNSFRDMVEGKTYEIKSTSIIEDDGFGAFGSAGDMSIDIGLKECPGGLHYSNFYPSLSLNKLKK